METSTPARRMTSPHDAREPRARHLLGEFRGQCERVVGLPHRRQPALKVLPAAGQVSGERRDRVRGASGQLQQQRRVGCSG